MFFRNKPLTVLQRSLGRHKVLTQKEDLLTYSYDVSSDRSMPEVVILAETVDDIIMTLNFAIDEGYYVTPRGAGTGMSAGTSGRTAASSTPRATWWNCRASGAT